MAFETQNNLDISYQELSLPYRKSSLILSTNRKLKKKNTTLPLLTLGSVFTYS